MTELTQRQAQLLGIIQQFCADNGFPPSIRELGLAMGIRSTNGVVDHLDALERKGYIRRNVMQSRTIVVLKSAPRKMAVGE